MGLAARDSSWEMRQLVSEMMEGDAPTRAKWQTVLRQMGSYRPDWALHLGDPYALAPAPVALL